MYSLSFVRSVCLNSYAQMYLSFNHHLKVVKYTTYIEKCIELDAVTYILTITKGYFSLCYEKIVFCLKRGVLLSLKISDFGWKRTFLSSKNSEKGVFFKLWYERGIRFGREGGGWVTHPYHNFSLSKALLIVYCWYVSRGALGNRPYKMPLLVPNLWN